MDLGYERRAFDDKFDIAMTKIEESFPITRFLLGEESPCMDSLSTTSLARADYKIYQYTELD